MKHYSMIMIKQRGGAYVHEKKTKLDKYQFEQILRTFGFLALKEDKVEYSGQLIYHLLEQSIKRFSWLKISIDDFLYDITHAVPFIQKDGNEYKWVHKSFMEYFASCFICYDNKESEEKYIKKMITSKKSMKYYNVLDFCYEMDTLNFRKYGILPYLEKYVDKYDNSFKSDYFKTFKKEKLHFAKQIVSITSNVRIVKFNVTKGEKFAEDIYSLLEDKNTGSFHVFNAGGWDIIVRCDYIDIVLYRIMIEKMPNLFKNVTIRENEISNIESGIKFYLNDDVNNPINKDEKLFCEIVERVAVIVFDESNSEIKRYEELNYKKCKKMIEEIKEEQEFQNKNIFDL